MKAQIAAGRVVLSPHPDDAMLSCWHVLTHAGDVTVVNVFTGTPLDGAPDGGWDRLTGALSSEERIRDRLAEDAEALSHVGRPAVNLGFLDAQYRADGHSVETIADSLTALIRRGTRVYAPAGLGGIPDHDIVRAAGVVLQRRGHEVVFYADLPHAIQFGWPASVTGARRDPAVDVDAYWDAKLTPWLPSACGREIHVLDDGEQAAKLAAIRAYRTQLPALVALNPRLAEPGTLRFEATWRRR